MSDFTGLDSIALGLMSAGNGAGYNGAFYKTSITTVAGFFYSGWTMGGAPAAGSAPTTWAHPGKATTGAWNNHYQDPGTATARVLQSEVIAGVAGSTIHLADRIGHMGGLSGTSAVAQSVNATLTAAASAGRCRSDGADVRWFLEWYSATGSTAVTATVNVTYDDNSTGNITIVLPASVPAFRMYPIQSAVAGRTIKGVNSVTLSATTGTAGNFGVTAYKVLATHMVPTANWSDKQDWAYLGMPRCGSDLCLCGFTFALGTSFGIVNGNMLIGAQ